MIVHDDVEAAADMLRPMYALYFGGMGARGANFHHDVPVRMGYRRRGAPLPGSLPRRQEGRGRAALPTKLVEELALIGPRDKIRHDLDAWRESAVTTLLIGGDATTVRRVAEVVLG